MPAAFVDVVDFHHFYNVWGPGVTIALVLVAWLSAVRLSMIQSVAAPKASSG